MDVLRGLLISFLKSEDFEKIFVNALEKVIEKECCIALEKIKRIIKDDNLDDDVCFAKIEEIICFFESVRVDCGSRHDF